MFIKRCRLLSILFLLTCLVCVACKNPLFSSSDTEDSPDTNSVLVSLDIIREPFKKIYALADSLDINGLIVSGIYADGTSKAESVTMEHISGYNNAEPGEQQLTISLHGKAVYFTVIVTANKVLRSIKITSPPHKTEYTKGQPLDITGLVIIGTYSDGSTREEPVTLADMYGYDSMSLGSQTIMVRLNGVVATFEITVADVIPSQELYPANILNKP